MTVRLLSRTDSGVRAAAVAVQQHSSLFVGEYFRLRVAALSAEHKTFNKLEHELLHARLGELPHHQEFVVLLYVG